MNVADVIIRVRRTFGDEAAVQVTDDDIIRWINDGQLEIVKHNDQALQKTDFIDLVAGTSQYTLPADLLILRSMRYKFGDMQSYSALKYKSMQSFDELIDGWDGSYYSTGNPIYFTMYEGNAILFPTPDKAMTAGIKLLYNKKPVDVTTTGDAINLPALYHNTIFKYCLWQASQLDEDNEVAMMHQSGFQQDMDLLMSNETKDATDTYPVITVLAGDW